MTNILVKTNGASITATADGKITSGMIGVPVSIEFDNSWDGLTKTAFFRFGDFVRKVSGISTTTTVPFEVLRFHGKPLEIGIEGRDADGNIVMPTVWASVATVYQGASGDVPAAPNPDSGETQTPNGAIIDDSVVSSDKTWSSQKISSEIEQSGGGSGGDGYTGGPLDMGGYSITNANQIECISLSLGNEPNHTKIVGGDGVILFPNGSTYAPTILRRIAPGTQENDAVTKGQLDEAIGDIETALDAIIAIQNSLIGGDEA